MNENLKSIYKNWQIHPQDYDHYKLGTSNEKEVALLAEIIHYHGGFFEWIDYETWESDFFIPKDSIDDNILMEIFL